MVNKVLNTQNIRFFFKISGQKNFSKRINKLFIAIIHVPPRPYLGASNNTHLWISHFSVLDAITASSNQSHLVLANNKKKMIKKQCLLWKWWCEPDDKFHLNRRTKCLHKFSFNELVRPRPFVFWLRYPDIVSCCFVVVSVGQPDKSSQRQSHRMQIEKEASLPKQVLHFIRRKHTERRR